MALVVGCGGSSEDAVMKEMLSLANQEAAIWEKGPPDEAATKELASIKEKGEALGKKVESWPKEKQIEMMKKYADELKAVTLRTIKAKMGGKLPDFKMPDFK